MLGVKFLSVRFKCVRAENIMMEVYDGLSRAHYVS